MPELPDVEVLKQYADATSLHQKIQEVRINERRILEGVSASLLTSALEGHTFESTQRHGKYLFVRVDDANWLMLHFGMTGDLKYFKDPDKKPAYDQLLVGFLNGYHLAYDAPRKLGNIGLLEDIDSFVKEKDLGPDVMESSFDFDTFQEIMAGKRAMLKTTLMNQQLMAGIGNVYSDEILFQARIHPRTQINQLGEKRLKEVFHTMKEVLQTAIDCRADPEQFPDTYLIPNRHKDGTCSRCGGTIEQLKISGRTAYYCPECQDD
jgi:formamidopyrimidine-DNA glycosylase